MHVCPKCYENRQTKNIVEAIIAFILVLFFLLPFIFVFSVAAVFFLFVFLISVYLSVKKKYPTIYDTKLEKKTADISEIAKPLNEKELYETMLNTYITIYGAGHGKMHLEEKIDKYVKQGLNREEAIQKVARNEGYT